LCYDLQNFSAPGREVNLKDPNLRRDATLIVPTPMKEASAYGHLASFVRNGPEEQRHALWRTVGLTMTRLVNPKPIWLSTAGGGVTWLHVRIDQRPKYYGYQPYQSTE
jgi:hypothetical protein